MERSASPLERTSAGQVSLGSAGSEGSFDFFDDHDESDSNSSSDQDESDSDTQPNYPHKHIYNAFTLADEDGSGSLGEKELATVIKNLGYDFSHEELTAIDKDQSGEVTLKEFEEWWQNYPHKQIYDAFTKADIDGSNSLEENELAAVINVLGYDYSHEKLLAICTPNAQSPMPGINLREFGDWWRSNEEKQIYDAFIKADVDGSNSLEENELAVVVRDLGYEFSDIEIHKIYQTVDLDGSGGINLQEFGEWWRKYSCTDVGGRLNISIGVDDLNSSVMVVESSSDDDDNDSDTNEEIIPVDNKTIEELLLSLSTGEQELIDEQQRVEQELIDSAVSRKERHKNQQHAIMLMEKERERQISLASNLADDALIERKTNQQHAIMLMEKERERQIGLASDIEDNALIERKRNQQHAAKMIDQEQERRVTFSDALEVVNRTERKTNQQKAESLMEKERTRQISLVLLHQNENKQLRLDNRLKVEMEADIEQKRRIKENDKDQKKHARRLSVVATTNMLTGGYCDNTDGNEEKEAGVDACNISLPLPKVRERRRSVQLEKNIKQTKTKRSPRRRNSIAKKKDFPSYHIRTDSKETKLEMGHLLAKINAPIIDDTNDIEITDVNQRNSKPITTPSIVLHFVAPEVEEVITGSSLWNQSQQESEAIPDMATSPSQEPPEEQYLEQEQHSNERHQLTEELFNLLVTHEHDPNTFLMNAFMGSEPFRNISLQIRPRVEAIVDILSKETDQFEDTGIASLITKSSRMIWPYTSVAMRHELRFAKQKLRPVPRPERVSPIIVGSLGTFFDFYKPPPTLTTPTTTTTTTIVDIPAIIVAPAEIVIRRTRMVRPSTSFIPPRRWQHNYYGHIEENQQLK